jgi:hypothetical protein
MSRQQVDRLALLEGATMNMQLQTLLRAWEARTMVMARWREIGRVGSGRMKRAEGQRQVHALGIALGQRSGVISHCGEGEWSSPFLQSKADVLAAVHCCLRRLRHHDGFVCHGRLR